MQHMLIGLRELPGYSPEVAYCGAEALTELLYIGRFLPYRPQTWGVEAAFEALAVEDEVLT